MKRALLLLAFTLVATAAFEGFLYYDWDHGVVRAGFVVLLLGLMFAARALGSRRPADAWPLPLTLVCGGVVGVLLFWHFKEGTLSARHERHSEMGDLHARGVALLLHGITPWHFGTVVDSGTFRGLVGRPEVVACRTTSQTPTTEQFEAMWESSASGVELFPERIAEPDCASARGLMAVTGYKYGPAMMAAYVPLVALEGAHGRRGVYFTHLGFLVAILAAMAMLVRRQPPEVFLTACLVLLGQSILRRNTLLDSDSDLIPTAFMLWALVAFERERPFTAGLLTGLTLAAKVFPAAFLLPLLLVGRRGRALSGFAVASLAAWAPALALDGVGVWDNVIRFNIDRSGDSTAFSWFLPPAVALGLQVVAVALCGWAFVRLVLRASPVDRVAFVAFSMGLFFLTTKVFHNNYLVWWLPVVGLTISRALGRTERNPNPAP